MNVLTFLASYLASLQSNQLSEEQKVLSNEFQVQFNPQFFTPLQTYGRPSFYQYITTQIPTLCGDNCIIFPSPANQTTTFELFTTYDTVNKDFKRNDMKVQTSTIYDPLDSRFKNTTLGLSYQDQSNLTQVRLAALYPYSSLSPTVIKYEADMYPCYQTYAKVMQIVNPRGLNVSQLSVPYLQTLYFGLEQYLPPRALQSFLQPLTAPVVRVVTDMPMLIGFYITKQPVLAQVLIETKFKLVVVYKSLQDALAMVAKPVSAEMVFSVKPEVIEKYGINILTAATQIHRILSHYPAAINSNC